MCVCVCVCGGGGVCEGAVWSGVWQGGMESASVGSVEGVFGGVLVKGGVEGCCRRVCVGGVGGGGGGQCGRVCVQCGGVCVEGWVEGEWRRVQGWVGGVNGDRQCIHAWEETVPAQRYLALSFFFYYPLYTCTYNN